LRGYGIRGKGNINENLVIENFRECISNGRLFIWVSDNNDRINDEQWMMDVDVCKSLENHWMKNKMKKNIDFSIDVYLYELDLFN
jgi:hypothetical protein